MKIKREIIGVGVLLTVLIILFALSTMGHRPEPTYVATTEKTDEPVEKIMVYITGAVNKPGVYEINKEARLGAVLTLAEGFTEEADTTNINLAKKLTDGEMIRVFTIESSVTYTGIDLFNYGTKEAILDVDGIGEVICERIIDYREKYGFYMTFQDLLNVEGIGEQKLKTIEKDFEN